MNKKIKIITFWFILLVGIILGGNKVEAASASISANKTTVNVGDSITVTLKYTAAAWDLHVNSGLSTSSSTDFASATDDAKNVSASKTITYKANKAGSYTISLSGTVSDEKDDPSSSGKSVGGKISVTVKEKSSSSNGGGSSNAGENTNGGTTTQEKPTKPTFNSVNQTVYITSEVNVRSSYSTSSSKLGSLKKGDSVTRIGIATKSVDGILWSKISYNGQTAYVSSSFLTTTKPEEDEEKSGEKGLKSLVVTPAGLDPTFDSETTNYTMTVGSNIDKIEVKAVAKDDKAKVSISGNTNLSIGENTIKIKVTAEDETVRTYKIVVTKEEEIQLELKELLVEGLPLAPEFQGSIYEYTVDLDRSDISEINITATPNKDDANIEILGNTELKPGENIITVLVKSNNGEEVVTYQITVNMPEATNGIVSNLENEKLYKYIGIGAIGIITIIIIIIVIVKRRKNKDDFDTYYGGFNISNSEEETKQKVEDKVETMQLNEEDLPKSLRKDKKVKAVEDEKEFQKDDRNKKIDAITSDKMDFDEPITKRRGKHSR